MTELITFVKKNKEILKHLQTAGLTACAQASHRHFTANWCQESHRYMEGRGVASASSSTVFVYSNMSTCSLLRSAPQQ